MYTVDYRAAENSHSHRTVNTVARSSDHFGENSSRGFVSEVVLWAATISEQWALPTSSRDDDSFEPDGFSAAHQAGLWGGVHWVGAPITPCESMSPDATLNAQLVELYPKLLAFLRCLVGPEQAEDLAQDTVKRALQNREQLLKHPNLLAWLKMTARNRSIDVFRKEGFLTTDALALDTVPVYTSDPADIAALRRAVKSLSTEEREVFVLHQAGHGFEAIGKRIGVATSTAFNRYRSAREQLMKKLGFPDPKESKYG